MIVVNEATLDLFRPLQVCEWCGRPTPGCDPHHCVPKGMGGGRRMDVRINLAGLCRGLYGGSWVSCHDLAEQRKITRIDIFRKIVAPREDTKPWYISDVLTWLENLDKDASDDQVRRSISNMNYGNAGLARKVWEEVCQNKATTTNGSKRSATRKGSMPSSMGSSPPRTPKAGRSGSKRECNF